MSTQSSEPPPPWYDDLDRRLSVVEGYQAQVLPFDIAATREAVRLVHTDLRGVSQQVTRQGQRLDQVAAEVSTVARSQIEHGAALAQLAAMVEGHTSTLAEVKSVQARQGESLAEVKSVQAQQGETLASHGEMLASHGEMLASHGEMLASHGEMLTSHGEMLAEILRRLPA